MSLTNAEKQKAFRERQRAKRERADKVMHFIDAFDDIELLLDQLEKRLIDLNFYYKQIKARVPVGDKNVT